ncbi:MAG: 30S ribosome-binding factor RbfA [Acidimicrobiaceae bacterium]|nr:30S ribosome-binding factor RbfA [Acidimicrobiaceae bacterium]
MAHSSGHHPYPRSARINQIIREVVSEELVRVADLDERLGFVTVTGVEVSGDMRHAVVYLDSLSSSAAEVLDEKRAQIQGSLNAQTRMKRTPRLHFQADPAITSGEAVEEIIRRLQDRD